ncbi:MAG: class I SAM-dependent RNA methyltransferase [Hyphomicrobiaceae bacterium]
MTAKTGPRGAADRSAGDADTLTISRLGSHGDGVAETAGGAVFVPFALPGETVRVAIDGDRGRLVGIEHASPDRIAPICRHFTHCGGCTMQHLAREPYAAWKRQIVVDAFAQRGIAADVSPLVSVGVSTRRRAALAARWTRHGVVLGYHEARGTKLVDLEECPVMTPTLAARLPALRTLIATLPRFEDEARLSLLEADNGFAVAVDDAVARADLSAALVETLASAASAVAGLIRLTVAGDPVYQRAAPEVPCGPAHVVPPGNVFLQASQAAEQTMAALVVAALPKKVQRVVDLFAGVGAFTFPLAQRARVLSVDGDATALGALDHARRNAQGLKPVDILKRDLFREPLSRKELEGFDAAIIDPPRAGARAQCEMIAKSKVPLVVAVSCNPATLARDCRILIDGGYQLGAVTPIDQFVFTDHVEVVAVLKRPK